MKNYSHVLQWLSPRSGDRVSTSMSLWLHIGFDTDGPRHYTNLGLITSSPLLRVCSVISNSVTLWTVALGIILNMELS